MFRDNVIWDFRLSKDIRVNQIGQSPSCAMDDRRELEERQSDHPATRSAATNTPVALAVARMPTPRTRWPEGYPIT